VNLNLQNNEKANGNNMNANEQNNQQVDNNSNSGGQNDSKISIMLILKIKVTNKLIKIINIKTMRSIIYGKENLFSKI
jgi:hypothetical protein